jgi:hypothetical protein
MRIEFRQGVPEGCTEWLNEHVGKGNMIGADGNNHAWFYKSECVYPQGHEAFDPRNIGLRYVPTITVKDPKLGTLFALRWTS